MEGAQKDPVAAVAGAFGDGGVLTDEVADRHGARRIPGVETVIF